MAQKFRVRPTAAAVGITCTLYMYLKFRVVNLELHVHYLKKFRVVNLELLVRPTCTISLKKLRPEPRFLYRPTSIVSKKNTQVGTEVFVDLLVFAIYKLQIDLK